MKHGVKTCSEPIDPKSIYMRNMYHEFFWGPFKDEQAVIDAIETLDRADPMWDYDPYCTVYGANPLPKDFVFGFPDIPKDMKERIENARDTKQHSIDIQKVYDNAPTFTAEEMAL